MDVVSKNAEMQEELVKRTEIKNTPFTVIETEGKVFGVMGKFRLTEVGDDLEMVKKELEEFSWNRLIQVVMLLIDEMTETDLQEFINVNNKK